MFLGACSSMRIVGFLVIRGPKLIGFSANQRKGQMNVDALFASYTS
jgi:hypothetical protein